MSYCQGTLVTLDPGTEVTRNVTECSNRTILSSFDPTQAWPKEITSSQDLGWARVISDDFHAFRMTSQVMAVMYCIGVGAMGAAILVRVWTTLSPRAGQGLFEFSFFMVSYIPRSGDGVTPLHKLRSLHIVCAGCTSQFSVVHFFGFQISPEA